MSDGRSPNGNADPIERPATKVLLRISPYQYRGLCWWRGGKQHRVRLSVRAMTSAPGLSAAIICCQNGGGRRSCLRVDRRRPGSAGRVKYIGPFRHDVLGQVDHPASGTRGVPCTHSAREGHAVVA